MNAKLMFKIFILFEIFLIVSAFGKRNIPKKVAERCCKEKLDPQETFDHKTTEKLPLDPHSDCELFNYAIVKKIPYAQSDSCGLTDININFSSACIKCGMCLSIAEQINRTLEDSYKLMLPKIPLNEHEMNLFLRSICDYSFKHYNLRDLNDKRYIIDDIPGSRMVLSASDNLWEENLKAACHEYLDAIGPLNVYNHWQKWYDGDFSKPDLVTLLCRNNDNLLQDCRNIDDMIQPSKRPKNYYASIKISMEYDHK